MRTSSKKNCMERSQTSIGKLKKYWQLLNGSGPVQRTAPPTTVALLWKQDKDALISQSISDGWSVCYITRPCWGCLTVLSLIRSHRLISKTWNNRSFPAWSLWSIDGWGSLTRTEVPFLQDNSKNKQYFQTRKLPCNSFLGIGKTLSIALLSIVDTADETSNSAVFIFRFSGVSFVSCWLPQNILACKVGHLTLFKFYTKKDSICENKLNNKK